MLCTFLRKLLALRVSVGYPETYPYVIINPREPTWRVTQHGASPFSPRILSLSFRDRNERVVSFSIVSHHHRWRHSDDSLILVFIARICTAKCLTSIPFSPWQVSIGFFHSIQSFRASESLLRGKVRKGIVATFSSNIWLSGSYFCISYSSQRRFWLTERLYSSG